MDEDDPDWDSGEEEEGVRRRRRRARPPDPAGLPAAGAWKRGRRRVCGRASAALAPPLRLPTARRPARPRRCTRPQWMWAEDGGGEESETSDEERDGAAGGAGLPACAGCAACA